MAEPDDVALIRRCFRTLQVCIQTVDFVGSRPLFATDMITFGTFTAFTMGREATEQEQWRHVWGHIDQFRWRLDDLRTLSSLWRPPYGSRHGGVRVHRLHRGRQSV